MDSSHGVAVAPAGGEVLEVLKLEIMDQSLWEFRNVLREMFAETSETWRSAAAIASAFRWRNMDASMNGFIERLIKQDDLVEHTMENNEHWFRRSHLENAWMPKIVNHTEEEILNSTNSGIKYLTAINSRTPYRKPDDEEYRFYRKWKDWAAANIQCSSSDENSYENKVLEIICDMVERFGIAGKLDAFQLRRYFVALLNMEPFEITLSDVQLARRLRSPRGRKCLDVREKEGFIWISKLTEKQAAKKKGSCPVTSSDEFVSRFKVWYRWAEEDRKNLSLAKGEPLAKERRQKEAATRAESVDIVVVEEASEAVAVRKDNRNSNRYRRCLARIPGNWKKKPEGNMEPSTSRGGW